MSIQIKVVSLAGSSDRREHMTRQLQALNLPWSFFDACTTLPDDLAYCALDARRTHGRELTAGELGCFASHFTLWRQLLNDPNIEAYCILEDDVLLEPSFFRNAAMMGEAFAGLPVVRLYAKVPAPLSYIRPAMGRHLVHFRRPIWGTQGYYITKDGARAMLAGVTAVVRPVDDQMDRFWENGTPIVALFPFPLMEVNFGSTIEGARRITPPLPPKDRLWRLMNRSWDKVRRISVGAFGKTPGR